MDRASCPICGSDELDTARARPRTSRSYDVSICRVCGHGTRAEGRSFADNIAIQEQVFDELARPPAAPARWPRRPALLARQVERLVGRSGRMLDIGCGPGDWLALFGERWKKFGVDVAPRAADMARKHTGAEVFCGPIEDYADAPQGLDLITAFALIEHLSDPLSLVRWSYEHLKPQGMLLLMTGDRESRVATELGARWPMYEPREHVHFFSARSLVRLVAKAGFAVVHSEWRAMHYSGLETTRWPGAARLERYLSKVKEIAGLTGDSHYDHLYLYARRLG